MQAYQFPGVLILGSTGSVGEQALDVAAQCGIKVRGISAHRNWKRVEQQARAFGVRAVAMTDESAARELRAALADTAITVKSGTEGLLEMIRESDAEFAVNSILGEAGLLPTLTVLESGMDLALANKESLVVAGEIVMNKVRETGRRITPVDSEHSAIFQALRSGAQKEIKKLILTCSGGPFFGMEKEALEKVTKADALRHPNWKMGPKITVDCATLMNKGLEVIEAMRLYELPLEQVDVVIHRQSIVHSLVEFTDGAVMAQLGAPDMRLHIQLAFTWPERKECVVDPLDLTTCGALTFCKPDMENFPCLALARTCAKRGGNACAAMNGANEEAVALFLTDKIGFYDIYDRVSRAVEAVPFIQNPTLEEILESDRLAREAVNNMN